MQTSVALADFLDQLAGTLKEAAIAARAIHDREADLPATLSVRHVAELEDCAPSTVWRRGKLGQIAGVISAPGEPLKFDRDTYLAHRRKRREQALAQAESVA
jgi:hypothetical protein